MYTYIHRERERDTHTHYVLLRPKRLPGACTHITPPTATTTAPALPDAPPQSYAGAFFVFAREMAACKASRRGRPAADTAKRPLTLAYALTCKKRKAYVCSQDWARTGGEPLSTVVGSAALYGVSVASPGTKSALFAHFLYV